MKVVKLEDCINEIKSLDNNGFVNRSVNHICEDMRKEVKEFNAIPLDRIKQAREEIENLNIHAIEDMPNDIFVSGENVLAILDSLIAESED